MKDWKPWPDFEGFYEVSDFGRVKSLHRNTEMILKPRIARDGYCYVCLAKPGVCLENRAIHRLVAITFIPNPFNLPEVNHLSGVKTENGVTSLEWTTHAGNLQHAYDTGLRVRKGGGGRPYSTKLPEDVVAEICHRYETGYVTLRTLASQYGMTPLAVSNAILRRKSWKKPSVSVPVNVEVAIA